MTNEQHASILQGADAATASLGFPVSPADIAALVKLGVLPHLTASASAAMSIWVPDACRLGAQVHTLVQIGGLFDETPGLFPRPTSSVRPNPSSYSVANPAQNDAVFLGLSPTIGLSYTPSEVPAEAIQVFIAMLRSEPLSDSNSPSVEAKPPVPIELDPYVTLWVRGDERSEPFRNLWSRAVRHEAATSFTESLATAKIYGNKARLTSFLVAVAGLHLPADSLICDLMAGTGIVAQRLTDYYHVYANDANPFAAHLTRCRSAYLTEEHANAALETVRLECEGNSELLRPILAEMLDTEAGFLHGVVDATSLERYRAFCLSFPQPLSANLPCDGDAESATKRLFDMAIHRRQQPRTHPYCLAAAFYANAYLGLAQSIAADGIRRAIDHLPDGDSRDLSLGALLLAVSSCSSGPHFAQPPKLNTESAMKEVIEHRARDLFAEFAMIFRLLSTRDPRSRPILHVWNTDWRDALGAFDARTRRNVGQVRGVYVDPPYTKLQYSRYYHVLNTLLRYNYPPCEGVGRYPPRSERFSSKFEFQPAAAAREFGELLDKCSDLHLITLISYSNRGFVPLADLAQLMRSRFRTVEVYSKPTRHHSQGKSLSSASKSVCEYVLVGLP